MPKVKTTYAYKIQPIVKEFPDEVMESIKNHLYCNLCNCAVSCNKRFLVDSHRNTSTHQKAFGSTSENLIPQTSQTFLRSSQWRRHGGDWGGTVPPTAQSGHFCESSKSDEKNLAVWGVTSSSIFGFLLNKVTKSIFFSQAMLFYFNHSYD